MSTKFHGMRVAASRPVLLLISRYNTSLISFLNPVLWMGKTCPVIADCTVNNSTRNIRSFTRTLKLRHPALAE